ncbi:MAG: 3-oxoadipate enol-lactonase [Burkholderiales bacterium]|nr:3-oxoadipate enol-lactonase [Burkholderiales bacterium]
MHVAPVAGTHLHYRLDGEPGAPVVLLSNSLGTTLDMWEPQAALLAQRYCVVRYDTRGHGQSDVPPGPYAMDVLGRDAVALLDHLGIARAAFCGLSLGGMTGMWLGVHAPQRVSRLVLANTAAHMGAPDAMNERIAAVTAGGVAAIAAAVLDRWFTPEFAAREPARVAAVKAMLDRTPAAGYVACCHAIRDMDQRADIARIGVPTLVVAGTHDPSTPPAAGRFLAERIPGARYVELPAAHLSNIEAASAFNAALAAFLAE